MNKIAFRITVLLAMFLTLLAVLPSQTAVMHAQIGGANSIIAPVTALHQGRGATAPMQAAAEVPSPSPEAQLALTFVAQREQLSIDTLEIVNDYPRPILLLGRSFQAVTLLDTKRDTFFQLMVDHDTKQVEDWKDVNNAHSQEYAAKYGKLQPELYEQLLQIKGTDVLSVTIMLAAGPGQSFAERYRATGAALAAKYPEAREAIQHTGNPMDVADPKLAEQIRKEYRQLMVADASQWTSPLAQWLQRQGYAAKLIGHLPMLTVALPKPVIEALAKRDDVGTIFWERDAEAHPALDTAIKTNRANIVQARGIDGSAVGGTGVRVAILELGNVDFTGSCNGGTTNCFSRPDAMLAARDGEQDHATLVASAAASNHSTYKGMAPGARIISAGIGFGDIFQASVDALDWALVAQSAAVVNASYGITTACPDSRTLKSVDWAYDWYALNERTLITVSTDNTRTCPDGTVDANVHSPGRGWNILTVGASNTNDNADWSDDTIASFSNYLNPYNNDNSVTDREKPEVVAPGKNITGVGKNGIAITQDGTSFAAPQVAGEAALLIHRNFALQDLPEALRAIIMATATNNVDGPTGIPTGPDWKDGAGSINADLADTVASTRGATPSTSSNACSGPCWWGECIVPASGDPSCPNGGFVGGYRYYYFNGQAGDRVRVAMSWWSNPECSGGSSLAAAAISISSCTGDSLATDLQLVIFAPSGALVNNTSASWNNNYELVPPTGELILPTTGTYKIAVYKASFNDTINSIGVAWTKLPSNSPAVSSWGANRLDVFTRGGDNAIWRKFWNGSAWSTWASLGGTATSDPDAVAWAVNRLDTVVRDTSNQMSWKYWNGSSWVGWAPTSTLAGGALSGPAISSWGANRLDVFVRGSDNAIWHTFYNGTSWSAWGSMLGSATSDPDAVSWGANRIDVVVRGGGNNIYKNSWNGTSWTGWVSIGAPSGGATSAPTISSWGVNRLDVFVRGTDNAIWHKVWNGTSWSAWVSTGGVLASSPDAASWAGSRIDAFAQGADNSLQQLYWTGSAWVGWGLLSEYP